MADHSIAVKNIADCVKKFYEEKKSFRIYHGSTNSTRRMNFDRNAIVDTSELNHVISVDETKKSVIAEPNVPMDMLVEATLRKGLVPLVVPEFPGITVGGAYSGTAGESSSFRHGLFEDTVTSIEIVLADGRIFSASEEENKELLHGAAGAFGTLGVVTSLEIRCRAAKQYVQLQYLPVRGINNAITLIETSKDKADTDFIDGILFSERGGFVIKGQLVDKSDPPNLHVQRFSRAHDPWFYIHARKLWKRRGYRNDSKTDDHILEVVPLVDYLFRYDRGAFWTGKFAFDYFFVAFNRVTRFCLDPLLHTRRMYHALHASGLAQVYIAQDLAVPPASAASLVKYTENELGGIWPLWLCPLDVEQSDNAWNSILHVHLAAVRDTSEKHDSSSQSAKSDGTNNHDTERATNGRLPGEAELKSTRSEAEHEPRRWILNVGVWGRYKGKRGYDAFVAANRGLEHKVRELGGIKTLYAHAYYTEDEFYAIYAREPYEALRNKWNANTLPTIYQKVRVNDDAERHNLWGIKAVRPFGGLIGIAGLLLKRDWLFAKK